MKIKAKHVGILLVVAFIANFRIVKTTDDSGTCTSYQFNLPDSYFEQNLEVLSVCYKNVSFKLGG